MQLFRNRNIANTIWNISDTFLYPALFFCSTSFFIQRLGPAQFGIWMLINTVVISMQVFNFGIGAGVFRNIAFHEARGNDQGKQGVLSNALSQTLLLFVLSLAAAGLLAWLVYRHGLLHVEPAYRSLCASGIAMAGGIVGFKFFELVFTSYFKGLEQFNRAMMISSGNKITGLLLNIALLYCFRLNILHLFSITLAVNVLFQLCALRLLYLDFPTFRFSFRLKQPLQEGRFALFTWLQSLAVLLAFQADRYLIVGFFGLAVLSYYAITATIFNHLHMALNSLLPWLAPKFTRLYAGKSDGADLYVTARNFLAAGSFVLLLLLYLLYPLVFRLVLGAGSMMAVDGYTRYFIVFELFFALNIIPTYYFNAMGRERRCFYLLLLFAVAAWAGMWASLRWFGEPLSVLYGFIAACLLYIFLQNALINQIIQGRLRLLQAFILLIPQLALAGFILSGQPIIKAGCIAVALGSVYHIYIRGNLLKFKLLFRS